MEDNKIINTLVIFVGKQRRLQFVECPNDINGMIDSAKFADLVLLLIDGSYGFEMVSYIYFLYKLTNLENNVVS